MITPFHLALPVHDLHAARAFYGTRLGCAEGRSAERWVDFDLFGHQLSLHLADTAGIQAHNPVDGDAVPIPHFGVILTWEDWHTLADRLRTTDQAFVIAPRIRFAGQVGEQATMFFLDPSGNALEFKSFRDPARIFAT
ncbi:MAG: glyoxalase [Deltaproteobacteria bacterium]|nr:glyoxalase [Deltaproteobacteria bacterium]HCH66926.1 glyoxalase [Deltaproteobacteria bacterium]